MTKKSSHSGEERSDDSRIVVRIIMQIKTNIANIKNYKIYLQVEKAVHEFMQNKGYLRVDVPVLAPALIPESYLEVFETEFNYFEKREKLYLTPSPELFLKRLLVAGIGDCYYLGKSFRNSEPNSSFHLPEFTMLEFYKVGATYLELADEILEMMEFIAEHCHPEFISGSGSKNQITKSIRQAQAFGSEAQARRDPESIEGQVRNDKYQSIVYQNKIISFDKWEKYTVAEAFEKFAGMKDKELFGSALFMKKAEKKGYNVKGFTYQDIFSQILSQEIEPKLGKNGYPTLLYDYPAEMSSLAKLNRDRKTARRVEFYIDGIEIGGCCEELNDWHEQKKRFDDQIENRDRLRMKNHAVDNGFIETLQYGLPDCTGAGIGFERLAMIFANVHSIDQLKLINIS